MNPVLLVFLTLSLTISPLFAMNDAYQYFQKRDKGIDNIIKAKSLYIDIIKSSKDLEVRKNALDKFARLSVYQGEVVREELKIDNKQAAKIFSTCIDVTEYLSPKKLKNIEVVEYTYWRATCIGLWAAYANPVKVALKHSLISELIDLMKIGQAKHKEFDSYGFNRMEAGMYIKSKALKVFNLYKPQQALDLIRESLAKGTDNYMSYIIMAECYKELKQLPDAVNALNFAINKLTQRLETNDIPTDMRAENQSFLRKMKEMVISISK